MEKLYGYKEQDTKDFIEFINEHKNYSLTEIFIEFALLKNKSSGTIRNLYYAIAKRSSEDVEFCKEYLNGEKLTVNPIREFDSIEERELVKKVLLGRAKGMSVRAVINSLSNGDIKKALRYQNKFRNLLKKNPDLIKEITEEIRKESGFDFTPVDKRGIESLIDEVQYKKIKSSIDMLVEKISAKLKKENEYLKNKVAILESENYKLKNILYGNGRIETAIDFIKDKRDKNILS